MSSNALHASLLRPAVIHILRASGFHSTKPSVLDTLTDVCARYMLLMASRTAASAYDRSLIEPQDIEEESRNTGEASRPALIPTISDVRNGMTQASLFLPGLSASEEAWEEVMRKPLSAYPAGARKKERDRRDLEDTQDVREFIEWAMSAAAKEMRRIAGLLPDDGPSAPVPPGAVTAPPPEPPPHKDDYLDVLKKKHGKSSDGSRYQGTFLGRPHDEARHVRIEGGPGSIAEWQAVLKRKRDLQDA